MKTCTKCHIQKELSKFSKRKAVKDGHRSRCKICCQIDWIDYSNRNRESIAIKQQEYLIKNRTSYLLKSKEYRQTPAGKLTQIKGSKKSRLKYPNAHKARSGLMHAIKSGKITRPTTCSECTSTLMIQGHHNDYDKPLDIRWLCLECHQLWHRHNTPLNR